MPSSRFLQCRHVRLTVFSVAATAFLLGWFTMLATPAGSWASSSQECASLTTHVDEGNATASAATDYFPARFPAPRGAPSDAIATF